jgi:D-methionine transport system ATP-binding protein
VQEAEHVAVDEAGLALADVPHKTIRRLTFMEDTVHKPILSRTAREFGIDFSILSGRIEQIKSTTCGQMTIALEGDGARVHDALAHLSALGVTVEEASA